MFLHSLFYCLIPSFNNIGFFFIFCWVYCCVMQQILIKTDNRIQNHYLSQAVWITKIRRIFLKALLQLWKPPQRNDNFTLNVQEVRWDFIGRFDCNRYSKQLVPRDLNWLLSVYRHNMQRQRWNYTAQFTTLKQSSIN